MKILDLSKKEMLLAGGISALVGIAGGEVWGVLAFVGGGFIAWALKPYKKVYVEVEYEDAKIPRVIKEIDPKKMKEKKK